MSKKVRLLNGRPILVAGKVAVADACCCNTTTCGLCHFATCDCEHLLSCEIKFDSTDNSNADFIELGDASTGHGFGLFYQASGSDYQIEIYSGFDGTVSVTLPGATFFTSWHSVCVHFCKYNANFVSVTLNVDGISNSGVLDISNSGINFVPSAIYVGAKFGAGDAHRTIKCVSVIGNSGWLEPSFRFPTDSFGSFTGGASIISGQLRIDQAGGVDAYGQKTFSKALNLTCQCDGTSSVSVNITENINGTCDSGIIFSTIIAESFSGSLTLSGTDTVGTVTMCVGSTNLSGLLHYACGAITTQSDPGYSFSIGRVIVAGTIDGTSYSVGDWVLGVASFADFGPLGACGPCSFSPTTYHPVLPNVSNTISITDFGVTNVVDLTFS